MFFHAMEEKVDFVAVYSTFSAASVAFIKSLFEGNNITYYIVNEHASSLALGKAVGAMTVMVAGNQLEEARELLRGLEE